MSTAIAQRANGNVANIDRELVRRTVAQGATDDELELFLYDCRRRNIHPLDKLLHFTKRGGRYVSVVSIDLMRSRAADTGELAGSDDATFEHGAVGKPPLSATVTVYRLTQGQRFAYTGTARWSEYNPGTQMWAKMPHTMLAKCAEALALRKAFPQELAGLYGAEEMDQAIEPVRVNPHVVRADDIVDVPAEGDPDRIPDGNSEIKSLPKKNARADFDAFQKELNATKTLAELEAWGAHQADRLQTYPQDWRDIARGLYVQHKTALLAKGNDPGPIPESLRRPQPEDDQNGEEIPAEPEAALKWIDRILGQVHDASLLSVTWDYKIEPNLIALLPPDIEEAQALYTKHERRLGIE